jgi:cytochrome d ubiquinol oxidase subunit I
VLTAFFLEATFLGIMLFGRSRVSDRVHLVATLMVAIGTTLSAFWILSANSWMQTPTGYAVNADGQFVAADWLKVIFNPSVPFRLVHTVTGFYLTTAFAVLAVTAWHLKRGQHLHEAQRALRMTIVFIAIFVPVQIVVGDLHGGNTLEHQPVKLAAMEGLWESRSHVPMVLFAIPDQAAETNHGEVAIPNIASYYLTRDLDTVVKGLKSAPPDDRPPVAPVFFAFRVMVGIGILMLITAYWGLWLLSRRRLFETRAYLNACIAMLPAGFIGVLAGWTVTEVGRQPWVVYGLMRTRDAVSPSLTGGDVLTSIVLYVVVYLIVFGAGIFYMVRLARAGPPAHVDLREPHLDERPARPLSGARADV